MALAEPTDAAWRRLAALPLRWRLRGDALWADLADELEYVLIDAGRTPASPAMVRHALFTLTSTWALRAGEETDGTIRVVLNDAYAEARVALS